jgi:tetraacyldisaccharide 4'-kinase
VSVGNLVVGGSGKTPVSIHLATLAQERGYRVAVLSRGYGRRSSAMVSFTSEHLPDVEEVGDEPRLIARACPGVRVWVAADRVAAARSAVQAGADLLLLDDGFQHRRLARDLDILVDAGEGNGWLLPAGPLREPRTRLERVDAVVINGGSAPPQGRIMMRLEARRAIALAGGAAKPLQEFTGASVHAIAGIGHPERFFNMLLARGIKVTPHPLDDHAPIGAGDLSFEDDKPVLMTEKDAVKCGKLGDARHWYVPVEACFSESDAHALLGIVLRAINAHRHAGGEV